MRAILAASLLLPTLLFPAAAVAGKPATDTAATTQDHPISTGVYRPSILQVANVICSPRVYASFPDDTSVVVKLKVDKYGRAENIRLLRSADPQLNSPVVAAVRQFSWRPAYLDQQAIPDNVILKVVVTH